MKLQYRLLSTGYHYVRDVDSAHLYAQWCTGFQCTEADVSAGEFRPDVAVLRAFVVAAQVMADYEARRVLACSLPEPRYAK